MNNSRLVYSTETGRVCPRCGQAAQKCQCKTKKHQCKKRNTGSVQKTPDDGVLRIRREIKGRKGKGVTTISGFDLGEFKLKEIAARLKRLCGSGGSVKDGVIIIQGDHRNAIQAELSRQGHKVKIAG